MHALRPVTRLLPLLAFCFAPPLLAPPAAQAQEVALGHTEFENSGSAAAQEPFLRGLLLLHSFEYDDAAEAFRAAQQADPGFAMAYWGEAMTYNHPLWAQQDLGAARAALNRLAPTPEARLQKAPTERERAYIRAADVLFGAGDKRARDYAFADAMERIYTAFPDDLDAAAFYALSILGTSHDGRDFRTYMKAAAVAEAVYAKNPNHPGAAHYLIHSYDDPIHAPLGVRAARAYSEIAPAAAHALHMPSHIFTALGMWDDVARLNEASWAAADARRERKGLGVGARSYHALHWLEYAYLQQGRYNEAREQLAIATTDARQGDAEGVLAPRRHLALMRAAYLVETRRWESAAANIEVDTKDLGPTEKAADLFATGVVAVKTGHFAHAGEALAAMKPLLDGDRDAYSPAETAIAVMTHELDALIQLSRGRQEQALALMEAAMAAEDTMPFDYGPVMPVKPSHELYGEVLLELGRPGEAQPHFEKALERAPRRALSLLGLARAAAEAGDQATADRAYAELQRVWHRADDLTELQEIAPPAPGGR